MRREFFQFPLALVCLMVGLVTPPTVGAQQSGASDLGATSQQPTDPEEQFKLGAKYFKGDGIPQDYSEAAKWFRKAAEREHGRAQTNLGSMYELGQGVPKNYAEAVKWYRRAAEQGYAVAQYNLGAM